MQLQFLDDSLIKINLKYWNKIADIPVICKLSQLIAAHAWGKISIRIHKCFSETP